MAVSKIGIHVPDDLDREAGAVYSASTFEGEDLDTTYELHETTDGITAIIGISSDAVGLVTWWRAGSLEEGMAWIDKQVGS